jgi:hypothetical protein
MFPLSCAANQHSVAAKILFNTGGIFESIHHVTDRQHKLSPH